MHSKYKLMESSLSENRKRLKAQLPDIQASLDTVRMLQSRAGPDAGGEGSGEAFPVHFALADQVHAKASVVPGGRVCLWLGANVMLEYSYAEAAELLEANLAAAQRKLEDTVADLDFVRENIITTEVRRLRPDAGVGR